MRYSLATDSLHGGITRIKIEEMKAEVPVSLFLSFKKERNF